MKIHFIILIVSSFVLLTLNCSKNNPQKQSSDNEKRAIPVNTITASSSGENPTTGNQITAGSANTTVGIPEAKINNLLKTLNSIKFNKEMYDFSNKNNDTALLDRMKILEKLKTNPSVLQKEDVKTTLIDLLNNEVKYSREFVKKNPNKELGEGYAEYEGELIELVYKYHDKRSLETAVVLLGDHGDFLTTYWKDSSQLVLQRIKDLPKVKGTLLENEDVILRQIAALGKAQKEKGFTLDPEIIKSFKEFAFSKLKDAYPYNREPAAEALQYIATKNDKEIIEALKAVAKTDPYKYGGIPAEYPVREAAQRALEYIEKQ